jgi:hypothetical protein
LFAPRSGHDAHRLLPFFDALIRVLFGAEIAKELVVARYAPYAVKLDDDKSMGRRSHKASNRLSRREMRWEACFFSWTNRVYHIRRSMSRVLIPNGFEVFPPFQAGVEAELRPEGFGSDDLTVFCVSNPKSAGAEERLRRDAASARLVGDASESQREWHFQMHDRRLRKVLNHVAHTGSLVGGSAKRLSVASAETAGNA